MLILLQEGEITRLALSVDLEVGSSSPIVENDTSIFKSFFVKWALLSAVHHIFLMYKWHMYV